MIGAEVQPSPVTTDVRKQMKYGHFASQNTAMVLTCVGGNYLSLVIIGAQTNHLQKSKETNYASRY